MNEQVYEHHLHLKNNKLCPFTCRHFSDTNYDITSNWHTNIEVLLFTEGNAYIQYDTIDFAVKKDDIVFVNSGVLHRPHSATPSSYYYMIIDESFCRENGLDVERCIFEKVFTDGKTKRFFLEAAEAINNYNNKKDVLSALKARAAVLNLLVNLCTYHIESVDAVFTDIRPSEKYVKSTLEYLNTHFDEELNLDTLASLCGITKFYLSRAFKAHTGQTIFTYITTLKCKKAQQCLSQGMTVTETALACGFESISYFSQTYKKVMGTSPQNEKKGRI